MLTKQGWIDQEISALPRNGLNAGAKACLLYQDKLSFRYHPEQKHIRLMIYGPGDERCLQIDYEGHLEQVLEQIAAIQDELSLDSYLGHYLALQSICPVSIVAIEQLR
jgi:hypothetical protein